MKFLPHCDVRSIEIEIIEKKRYVNVNIYAFVLHFIGGKNLSKCENNLTEINIFSYIALLCSLSTRQAPKPLRETIKRHRLAFHSYFLLIRECVMHTRNN